MANGSKEEPLDLRKPEGGSVVSKTGAVVFKKDSVALEEKDRTDPYSLVWAKVVSPIAKSLLLLLATVMLLPFAFFYWLTPGQVRIVPPPGTTPDQAATAMRAAAEAVTARRLEGMLDWAKTVLPSVVGFASAMVGYYFGTRAGQTALPGGSQGQQPAPAPGGGQSEQQPQGPNPPQGGDQQREQQSAPTQGGGEQGEQKQPPNPAPQGGNQQVQEQPAPPQGGDGQGQ